MVTLSPTTSSWREMERSKLEIHWATGPFLRFCLEKIVGALLDIWRRKSRGEGPFPVLETHTLMELHSITYSLDEDQSMDNGSIRLQKATETLQKYARL